jgi:protoheme IX farnesyltransferase
MKQRTWLSTTVGAFPGAMPPLIGFAAARGALTVEAWILFAIIFLWQFPHFYAIAWMYKDDYARAGIRMLPVVEPDGLSTSRHILAFALLLLPVSLLPGFLNMTGHWYLAAALLLGAFFLRAAVRVARDRTLPNARLVLKASVIYLPLLYAALVLDRHVRL